MSGADLPTQVFVPVKNLQKLLTPSCRSAGFDGSGEKNGASGHGSTLIQIRNRVPCMLEAKKTRWDLRMQFRTFKKCHLVSLAAPNFNVSFGAWGPLVLLSSPLPFRSVWTPASSTWVCMKIGYYPKSAGESFGSQWTSLFMRVPHQTYQTKLEYIPYVSH